jgi:hypothetical protein
VSEPSSKVVWRPNPGPQTAFLASTAREVLYGGAAGGGKSDALVMLPMRWVDHPKNRALILRRTRPQLQEIIDRAKELYPKFVPGIDWVERESRFRLPAGGFIQMGYAEHEDDIMAFKSFEYNVVCFDEATSFTPRQYLFLFSRNRSKAPDLHPIMRAASNPGDVSHEFFFNRFIRNRRPYEVYKESTEVLGKSVSVTRQFIPAKVLDNPKLANADEYIAGLIEMGEEGLMYLHGMWTNIGGTMFKKLPVEVPARLLSSDYYLVRSMDYGLTDETAVYWAVVYPSSDPKATIVDVVGEVYINEASVDNIAETIKQTEENLGLGVPVMSVGDPKMFAREGTSMQSIATMLDARGVHFDKANNDRVAGWAQIQRHLYRGTLRVWVPRAPALMRTLPSLMVDPKKPNDIKSKQEDHAADSLRYLLMAIYENPPKIEVVKPEDGRYRDLEFDKMVAGLQRKDGEYIPDLGVWG